MDQFDNNAVEKTDTPLVRTNNKDVDMKPEEGATSKHCADSPEGNENPNSEDSGTSTVYADSQAESALNKESNLKQEEGGMLRHSCYAAPSSHGSIFHQPMLSSHPKRWLKPSLTLRSKPSTKAIYVHCRLFNWRPSKVLRKKA